MDPAQDEGDVWAHGRVEERDVLDCLPEGALLGVDLAAATEDGDGLQTGLVVDPFGPELAVGFEAAPADVWDRG